MLIHEAREQDRMDTLPERKATVLELLGFAENATSHWLAFNLIDAARVVWSKEYDVEFDTMAAQALRHARTMGDEWQAAYRASQSKSNPFNHVGGPG